ncbi:hypothetical protein BGX28_005372 [Mortierella sp. GBA30]|nr:hypothetical protein BGX28_005372 [Mortierella sp. GBA30]
MAVEEGRSVESLRLVTKSTETSTTVSSSDGWCSERLQHHIPKQFAREMFQHLSRCPKLEPQVLPIIITGDAGICVDSGIEGHQRRGGSKMRARHRRYCPVAMRDGFHTSRL